MRRNALYQTEQDPSGRHIDMFIVDKVRDITRESHVPKPELVDIPKRKYIEYLERQPREYSGGNAIAIWKPRRSRSTSRSSKK